MNFKLIKSRINGKFLKSLFRPRKEDRIDPIDSILADVKFKKRAHQNVVPDELPYDFAIKCITCGELMPKDHIATNMGKCVDCTEKVFFRDTDRFIGRIAVFGLLSVLAIVFTLILFEVILSERFAELTQITFIGNLFRGRSIFAFVGMACLYAPLKKLMVEKIPDSKPSFITFIILLGNVAMFTSMLVSYYVVIFVNIGMWLLVIGILAYEAKRKYDRYNIIKRFKHDSIQFKGKITRMERNKPSGTADEAAAENFRLQETGREDEENATEEIRAEAPPVIAKPEYERIYRKTIAPVVFASEGEVKNDEEKKASYKKAEASIYDYLDKNEGNEQFADKKTEKNAYGYIKEIAESKDEAAKKDTFDGEGSGDFII